MKEFSIYDLNLVLQLAIFALFLLGIYHIKARKKSLGRHRLILLTARTGSLLLSIDAYLLHLQNVR